MDPSSFSRIYCILGIGNGFLRMIWLSFLELDKNLTILFFFGWIKVGDTQSNLFTLLSNPSWKILPTYLLKTSLCALGSGHGFAWYDLEYDCSYILMGLFFWVPNVPLKRNSYLVNILWSISCSSSVKTLLYEATL